MAKYAQTLAGRHWRIQPDAAAAAAGGRGRECWDPRIRLGAAPQYLAGMIAAGQIMTVVGFQASLGGHWRTGMMLLRLKGASICLAGGSKPSQRCSCNQ